MVWQNVIVALIGIWFIIAPSSLGFTANPAMTWTSAVGGVILLILGASAALSAEQRRQFWIQVVNALVGIWFIIAPWILSFTQHPAAFWTSLILGIVALILSVWDLQLMPRAVTSPHQTR
ncbi:MAG TPA: SPW repeat protein [bacterium]|nr:SPW repeat protein [bacterium]